MVCLTCVECMELLGSLGTAGPSPELAVDLGPRLLSSP